MKIRIMGTRAELAEAGALLGDVFELLEVSEPYRNKGASVLYRLYVEATLYPKSREKATESDE